MSAVRPCRGGNFPGCSEYFAAVAPTRGPDGGPGHIRGRRVTLSFRSRLTLRWVSGFGLVLALALSVVYVGIRAFLVQDLDASFGASDARNTADISVFQP